MGEVLGVSEISEQDLTRLCWRAVEKWGLEAQLKMVVEEAGELIVALMHLDRGRIREGKVVEEAVDLELMLKQLEHMIGGPKLYSLYRKRAIENLMEKLETSEAE